MKTKIVRIGNSKGIRIPKSFLEEAKLETDAEITLEKGALVIRPAKTSDISEDIAWSYLALDKDWDNPEEDKAWAHLQ